MINFALGFFAAFAVAIFFPEPFAKAKNKAKELIKKVSADEKPSE